MTVQPTTPRPSSDLTMAQLLCAFAYASDLAFGLQLEDTIRSSYLAYHLAREMGLPDDDCRAAYYTALLKDAGCTSWTTELARAWRTDEIAARRDLLIFSDARDKKVFFGWMRKFVARDDSPVQKLGRYCSVLATSTGLFAEGFATTVRVAVSIAARLGMPLLVQESLVNVFEHWNGGGAPAGASGESIPIASRIVLPTFSLVPFHRVGGRGAAMDVARHFRGRAFDPAVIDAYERLATDEDFWAGFEAEDIRDRVLALEPAAAWGGVPEGRIDDVALAFADFIDLKSRYAAAHSRRVGAVAEQLARLVGAAESAVVQIRRAALMHDLGLVGVPSYSIDRPWRQLSESEKDEYRLHPYHGERILKRVPALAPLAEMIGTHQERYDGSGYYRGLTGNNISLGARIIAVADRLDELTHPGPEGEGVPVPEALDILGREPLDPEIVATLRRSLGERPAEIAVVEGPRPANLTEREVAVLRLMTQGLTRREIGRRLSIAENTVRNHLDHIYDKTGTTNRVSATMFAMENGLLLSV